MQIKCFPVKEEIDLTACKKLRQDIFVGEQNVPEEIEADGLDAAARHFAVKATDEDGMEKIIATCRVRLMGSAAKVERVAVLKDFREMGIGRILMRYILQELTKAGEVNLFKLSAQAHTVPFYEKFGFIKRGDEYIEAGMPHYDMVLERA